MSSKKGSRFGRWEAKDKFQKKKIVGFEAKSARKDGSLTLTVRTSQGLDELIDSEVEIRSSRERAELRNVLPFWNFLQETQPGLNSSHQILFQSLGYRITFRDFDPLSIAGSLAFGGRFNIGGTQNPYCSFFKGLSPEGCLYLASSETCALNEATGPSISPIMNRITPKSDLKVWDLEAIIPTIDWPNLTDLIGSQPLGSNWGLQRVPTVSQLLAAYVRSQGGDGLVYRSSRTSGQVIFAMFIKDDNQAKQKFDTTVLIYPPNEQTDLEISPLPETKGTSHLDE